MSHHVDPAAIAEEARTVRLAAVLGPPRRSVPVGDSSTPESRILTPSILVRIQVPSASNRCVFVVSSLAGIVLKLPRVSYPANASATPETPNVWMRARTVAGSREA